MDNKETQVADYVAPYSLPVEKIECPPFDPETLPEIKAILEKHGAKLEEAPTNCLVTFPAGTNKYPIYPTVNCDRYKIIFPDGFELEQQDHPNGKSTHLQFPLDLFSEKIQQKYRR